MERKIDSSDSEMACCIKCHLTLAEEEEDFCGICLDAYIYDCKGVQSPSW